MPLTHTFFPTLLAFVLTAGTTPLAIIILKKLKFFDDPKIHRHPAIIHTKPVLRGGSIPFFLGIAITSFFFLPITNVTVSLFIASIIALAIGVLDDKLDVSPYLRFFGNFIVAGIVVGSGISIPFVTNPLGGILHFDALRLTMSIWGYHLIFALSDMLALFWIVWVMNMLNWSKGVDGQMPGIVAISSIIIGILSLRFPISDTNTFISSQLSFIIGGSALGFLLYNFYPAKIFPGYGATAVYLLLATVAILSSAKLATAILVMGVPMIDGIFTVLRRILAKKSPFRHDRRHLHHLLLDLGFKQRTIALFYWILSAIVGTISLTLSSTGKLFAILMLAVLVGGMLVTLHSLVHYTHEETGV